MRHKRHTVFQGGTHVSRNCQTLQRKFRPLIPPSCECASTALLVWMRFWWLAPSSRCTFWKCLIAQPQEGEGRDPLPPNPTDDAPRASHNECSHCPSIGANAVSPLAHRFANATSDSVESTCAESWSANVGKRPATAYQLTKENPQPLLPRCCSPSVSVPAMMNTARTKPSSTNTRA